MNAAFEFSHHITDKMKFKKHPGATKSFSKNERKLLKAFLISYLHKLFCKIFYEKFQSAFVNNIDYTMESYAMDGKIIQVLINEIIETGEYTLEGIANYTRIPLDIIVDASFCNSNKLSITPWARIVDLYMQVKPEMSGLFFEKLIEAKEKHHFGLSLLLNEN